MKFLTVEQVAEIIQKSPSWVYEALADGVIVGHRIGGSLRVAEADLRDYLDGCGEDRGGRKRKVPRPKLKHIRI